MEVLAESWLRRSGSDMIKPYWHLLTPCFYGCSSPPLEMRIGFWPAQQDLPDKSLRSFTGWFGLLPQRNGCKGCGSAAPYGWWFPSKFLIDLAPQLYSFQLRVKRNEANMSIAGCPFAVIYYTYIYRCSETKATNTMTASRHLKGLGCSVLLSKTTQWLRCLKRRRRRRTASLKRGT